MSAPDEFFNPAGDLLHVVALGNIQQVERLLDSKGINVNVADYDKRTALHLAASEGHLEMLNFLVARGADVNAEDRFGNTPLDDSLRHTHAAVSERLVQLGAKVGAKNTTRFDLLDAASKGDMLQVRQLIESGLDPNIADYDGRTPLHLAVAEGHFEMCEYLLSKGANPKSEDRWGLSPAEDAQRRGQRTGDDPLKLLFAEHAEPHSLGPHGTLLAGVMVFWQIMMIVLFAVFSSYGHELKNISLEDPLAYGPMGNYAFWQDVHVMIFIGFGYLMTFLRRYGFSSLGFTFLLAAMVIQWHPMVDGFWHRVFKRDWHRIELNLTTLLLADFAAGAVLITYGGLLGKASPLQLMVLAIWEVNMFSINENIGLKMKIADIGGSMVIHMFGAYFGLAASFALTPKRLYQHEHNASAYHADLFAMIGTIFLWLFWPSFNGAPGAGPQQHRAVVNTVFSLSGSCFTAFVMSLVLRVEKRFNMVDIQNATLAGGVAIGTCADMMVHPAAALGIGCLAGALSVVGYVYIQGFLESRLSIDDTCGINNLHGMPSILGAFAGVIASGVAKESDYGPSFGLTFKDRVPPTNRSAGKQALFQFLFILITLGISIASGLFGGFVCSFLPGAEKGYSDDEWWETPGMEIPYYFDERGEISRGSANAAVKEKEA